MDINIHMGIDVDIDVGVHFWLFLQIRGSFDRASGLLSRGLRLI